MEIVWPLKLNWEAEESFGTDISTLQGPEYIAANSSAGINAKRRREIEEKKRRNEMRMKIRRKVEEKEMKDVSYKCFPVEVSSPSIHPMERVAFPVVALA
jgi:hypothetical protein